MALLKEGNLCQGNMRLKRTDESGIEICNSPVIILWAKNVSLVCSCLSRWRKAEKRRV